MKGVGREQCAALVVGLGNPGSGYERTRHNAGFMAADALAAGSSREAGMSWAQGELVLLKKAGRGFLVLKPGTFMNRSGQAVLPVLRRYRLDVRRLVVIHDDIDIPLGEVRTKIGGGTGGHRGVASVVEGVGDPGFWRVRIGVGRPPVGQDPVEYVLSPFPEGDMRAVSESVRKAADLTLELVEKVSGA